MENRETVLKDPVHGDIRVSPKLMELIDHPQLQRLRWVSQLSGVKLIFPGGTHNRLAHMIGVMHLARNYSENVFGRKDCPEAKATILAGLLHDIAHGPFSHIYDDTVYQEVYPGNPHGHDTHRIKLIRTEGLRGLIESCNVSTQEIEDIWTGKSIIPHSIAQGAIGADRLDFLLRDSYFTGAKHFGTVEASRIINNSVIAKHNGVPALHYNIKILDDIFQTLLGRFWMYKGVYFHKTSTSADILINRILKYSSKPLNLAKRTINLEEFQYLNDYTLIGEIMASKDEELDLAKSFCKRLLSRQLPKLVWEEVVPESATIQISKDTKRAAEVIANERFRTKIYEYAEKLGKTKPELYIYSTYPTSTIDSIEFDLGNTYILKRQKFFKEKSQSLAFSEVIDSTTYFKQFVNVGEERQRYVTIRVYADKEDFQWISKEKLGEKKKENLSL